MDADKLKDLATRNPLVADAVAELEKHGHVYGKSNTAKVRDAGRLAAIKAACRVIHEAELAELRPADGRNPKAKPRRAAELVPGAGPVVPPGRARRCIVPQGSGPMPAALNKVLRLLEDGLDLDEVPAILVHAAKAAIASRLGDAMSPELRAAALVALRLAAPVADAVAADPSEDPKPRKKRKGGS